MSYLLSITLLGYDKKCAHFFFYFAFFFFFFFAFFVSRGQIKVSSHKHLCTITIPVQALIVNVLLLTRPV